MKTIEERKIEAKKREDAEISRKFTIFFQLLGVAILTAAGLYGVFWMAIADDTIVAPFYRAVASSIMATLTIYIFATGVSSVKESKGLKK